MVNKVILVGRLGSDPQTREVNGANVSSFSLATSESYRDRDGNRKENTEWHSIVCWRNLADIVSKYCRKGDAIYIEGKLHTRSWETDRGEKRYSTDIVAQELRMLGGKKDDAPRPGQSSAVMQGLSSANQGQEDGDLPFS